MIIEVITEAVVKVKPKKIGLIGVRTHGFCDIGAVLAVQYRGIRSFIRT